MRGRPARRQPGPHRPDELRAQAADVPAARADGLQGDRGRLPVGEPDRLRLLPRAHRGRPHPRRRDDPGADAVPRPPHRAHLRRHRRLEAGDRALLQLDLGAAAPRRLRARAGRHHRHRRAGGAPLPQARGDHPRHADLLRVLARVLHRHRARLRGAHLQRRHRRHRPDARPQDDRQPAGDRRDGDAQRLRRLDRVDGPPPRPARVRRRQPAPAQRPRHGRRGGRARLPRRRRPHRGLPLRQRRAHRQRLSRHARHEPLRPGHRPADRLQRHRRGAPHRRALQPAAGRRAPPLRRRPRLHGLLRLAPGRHQEGLRGDGRRGQGEGHERRRPRLGRALPAHRPARPRPLLRGRRARQQPVRQGRRRLHHEDRAPDGPAAPAADRVLRRRPAWRRPGRRRGRARRAVGEVPGRVPPRPVARLGPLRARQRRDRLDRRRRQHDRGDDARR